MRKKIIFMTAGMILISATLVNAQSWSLTGNAGTDPAVNYIGTTDANSFKIKTNGQTRIQVTSSGNVKIGSGAPASKLDVGGTITATGGNSNNWNTAYGWGNHATVGYLTSFTEVDPEVGTNSTNYIPRWNGSALVTGLVYDNGTRIGIGTAAPLFTLHANSSTELRTVYIENSTSSASNTFGLYALASGAGSGDKRAASFDAINGTGTNIALRTTASGGALNYAAYFAAGNVYAAGLVGIGNTTPASRLTVTDNSTNSSIPIVDITETAAPTASDVRGLRSNVVMDPGWGIGVEGIGGYMGVRGEANSTTYTGTSYGIYGYATGTAGTRIGVYGVASGGTENWGGYFSTKTYTNELRVGTTNGATGYILCVGGKAIAEEVRVELEATWPDYVFDSQYNLLDLGDLQKYITKNKHLPGMPSACEIKESGHLLGAIQTRLVEKTEENTLYILQLKKEIESLKAELHQLKNK